MEPLDQWVAQDSPSLRDRGVGMGTRLGKGAATLNRQGLGLLGEVHRDIHLYSSLDGLWFHQNPPQYEREKGSDCR